MADYEALTIAPAVQCRCRPARRRWPRLAGAAGVAGNTFDIGDAATARVALFGGEGYSEPQRIEIGRAAVTITFAHTLPTSRLPEGDIPGATVAVYRVHFADGTRRTSRFASDSRSG